MAVRKIPIPFCDWCKQPFLPKFVLKDGTPNPIFDHPERSKRCGKCKRTGWNAGGVDRRRKKPAAADEIPQVTAQDVIQTIDIAPRTPRRCMHNLFKCQKCHPEKAA